MYKAYLTLTFAANLVLKRLLTLALGSDRLPAAAAQLPRAGLHSGHLAHPHLAGRSYPHPYTGPGTKQREKILEYNDTKNYLFAIHELIIFFLYVI